VLAKEIATLQALSGDRFVLGTAAGHMEREFEILGVPFRERGRRTDEYLRVMQELWSNDRPSFKGRYVEFDKIAFEPKPATPPQVLIGGNSEAAMRRAAKMGDGWLPWLIKRPQLRGCLDFIEQQDGFDKSRSFEVVMPLATLNVEDYSHRELGKSSVPRSQEAIIEEVGLLAEAGATGTLVAPPRAPSVDHFIEWMEWFAAEVMPAVSRA
jgi:alkanesulfonate monooxygenase SsuD/methylene tetrahydromethanopterin reductase-like flavin-dependent oxidoreductase (luciferase family)